VRALTATLKCSAVTRSPSHILSIQAAFPEGGPRSQLAATLERCTQTLTADVERYKGDVRFLRVWLLHVRAAACALEAAYVSALFPRLTAALSPRRCSSSWRFVLIHLSTSAHPSRQHNSIGLQFALFYEARAAFSELRGNFALAESIYQQGLRRNETTESARATDDAGPVFSTGVRRRWSGCRQSIAASRLEWCARTSLCS